MNWLIDWLIGYLGHMYYIHTQGQMSHIIRSILGIEKESYRLSKNPCQYSIFQTCGVHLIFSEAQSGYNKKLMIDLYVW